MKKLLIGLLALGSLSTFACEWSVKKNHIELYKSLAKNINNIQIDNWSELNRSEFNELNSTEAKLLHKVYDVIEGECKVDTKLVSESTSLINKF